MALFSDLERRDGGGVCGGGGVSGTDVVVIWTWVLRAGASALAAVGREGRLRVKDGGSVCSVDGGSRVGGGVRAGVGGRGHLSSSRSRSTST